MRSLVGDTLSAPVGNPATNCVPVEEGLRIDLAAFNGDPSWTLTMPTRCVLALGGTIEYADISVDYTGADPALRPLEVKIAEFGVVLGPRSEGP